jgi:hypothetical protein
VEKKETKKRRGMYTQPVERPSLGHFSSIVASDEEEPGVRPAIGQFVTTIDQPPPDTPVSSHQLFTNITSEVKKESP